MDAKELQERLKQFAYRVVNLTKRLPDNAESKIIKGQIIRSSFSSASNYRSACRAYTKKAFNSKLAIALEEIDESVFWLEVIIDLKLIKLELLSDLLEEGNQLCKILAKSLITARAKPAK